ncbi:MAG: nuclear transport factor 2 family protein [Rhizobiales bacterium]|nr:nuclear transport factor 2 family protein [Hyphomicrobiales bacterium]
MAGDPIARVKAYHAALNAFDLDAAERMFGPHAEYHSPSVGAIVGRAAIFAAMRGYFAEYPDQVATAENYTLIAADKVRSDWHLAATSKSTGTSCRRRGVETITLDATGLVTRIEVEDQ